MTLEPSEALIGLLKTRLNEEELGVAVALVESLRYQDSLEIGTPAKGGKVKVYYTFADPEGFIERVKNASEVNEKAMTLMERSA